MKSALLSEIPVPALLGTLVGLLAMLAGVSSIFYPSPYSPLLFLGVIVAIGIFIIWLAKPVWALYSALFLVLLPIGLIPPNVHSMLNRSVTVIAAGVWLIRLLNARKKIEWRAPTLFMFLFLIWSSITLFWADKMVPATNALQVYSLRFLLFLFLIPNEITTKRELNGFMNTLALSGWVLILSFIGIFMVEGYGTGARLKVFGENENMIGTLSLMGLVGVIWGASKPSGKHVKLRTLATALYFLLAFCLVALSGSRGSALSLIVIVSIFWVWKPLRRWGKFGFLIALLALIFTPSIFTTLIQRFALERGDTQLGGREVLWQAAWHVIQDHPLGGVGIGNAPYTIIKYLETDPHIIGAQASVHNPILTIWSETAILGIFLYLSVLISAIYSFCKRYLAYRKLGSRSFTLYFALVSSVTVGYLVSWIKGGGMESHFTYFLILSLLLISLNMDSRGLENAALNGGVIMEETYADLAVVAKPSR